MSSAWPPLGPGGAQGSGSRQDRSSWPPQEAGQELQPKRLKSEPSDGVLAAPGNQSSSHHGRGHGVRSLCLSFGILKLQELAPWSVRVPVAEASLGSFVAFIGSGDLVQERHGDQSQAARAISSRTPMWSMANGVYC